MPFHGLQTSYHPVQTTPPLLLRTDRKKLSANVYLTKGLGASIFRRNLVLEPSWAISEAVTYTHEAKTLTVALSLGVILVCSTLSTTPTCGFEPDLARVLPLLLTTPSCGRHL
jgi:hypothetical protein